jgi:hypothetical protein
MPLKPKNPLAQILHWVQTNKVNQKKSKSKPNLLINDLAHKPKTCIIVLCHHAISDKRTKGIKFWAGKTYLSHQQLEGFPVSVSV